MPRRKVQEPAPKKKDVARASPETAGQTHYWTYMGRRLDGKGKVLHGFQTHEMKAVYFAKAKAHAIGHRYSMTVVQEGDNSSVLLNTIKYHDDRATLVLQTEKDQWIAQDAAAMAELNLRRLERRQGNQLLTMTLNDIARIAQRMPSTQRQALAGYVITKIVNPLL